MSFTIFSVDQGTRSSGWAIFSSDSTLLSYGVVLAPKESNIFDRTWEMYKSIRKLLMEHKPDYIIIEDISLQKKKGFMNVETLKALARLQGFLIALAYQLSIRFELVYPSSWRSAIGTLKGESKDRDEQKRLALEYVNKKYGMSLKQKDNDISDAIAMGEGWLKIKNGLDKEK